MDGALTRRRFMQAAGGGAAGLWLASGQGEKAVGRLAHFC
ncbi:MAG: twin-arginine translocation signal domain-containing protein [Verrucomicrobia bacterium]|nr:twin-arginine translocation signal domain-containing protein [Verrucomicrobiota bacterium]